MYIYVYTFYLLLDSMAGDREAVEAVLQEHVAFRRRKSSFIGTPSRGTGLVTWQSSFRNSNNVILLKKTSFMGNPLEVQV
jgi:hypothetical protein